MRKRSSFGAISVANRTSIIASSGSNHRHAAIRPVAAGPVIVRRVLREQIVILHRRLLATVRDDEVCRRLMTTPGVGPVVSLTYRATVVPQLHCSIGGFRRGT